EIRTRAGAPLKEHAFCTRQPHDRFHAVAHRIDKAGGTLWLGFDAHVEPYRRVESHFLLDQQVRQFVAESVARSMVGEIAALFAPAHHGVHHARDELAHRSLALGATRLAVEILAGHDVGGGLRPVLRYFDIVLAENGHAFFI